MKFPVFEVNESFCETIMMNCRINFLSTYFCDNTIAKSKCYTIFFLCAEEWTSDWIRVVFRNIFL